MSSYAFTATGVIKHNYKRVLCPVLLTMYLQAVSQQEVKFKASFHAPQSSTIYAHI